MSKRTAGGIDPQEDATKVVPGLSGMVGSYSSWDVAHSAYVFEYITGTTTGSDSRAAKKMAMKLAEEYAERFAGWLGHVFLNRANMTRRSKAMKELTEGLGTWTEAIPKMLEGHAAKDIGSYMTPGVEKFLKMDKMDQIGKKILFSVQKDWKVGQSSSGYRNASLNQLPITFNAKKRVYEIPKSNMTFPHRRNLRDLGFDFDGKVWYTDNLDSDIIRALPQVAQLTGGAPEAKADPLNTMEWFFDEWLPSNISRFAKVFNTYGKSEGVPYEFKFSLHGDEVTVDFRRNIKTTAEAITEMTSRYGNQKDRGGWMLAIRAYKKLQRASGMSAMHEVDMANNLEHTHGAMMEHFPPGIRKWYPRFLDFKYTADIWQMVRAIKNSDLRLVAQGLLGPGDQMRRLSPKPRDHRTPKGLALEISSQPGKSQKRKMLQKVKDQHPDLYDKVLENLAEKGLKLGASRSKVATLWMTSRR